MAAYAQYGCGYPSANQYLTAGTTLTTLPTHHPISQSPIATTPSNAPSISPPSHGHDSNVSGDNNSGTLTPDPASQTSTATMGTASVATGTSSTDSGNAYSCAAATNGTAASVVPTLCCDNGQPMMTDPISGQTVCSCQYDPARLALSSYARMQSAPGVGVGVSVYGAPYPSNEQNPYPSIGVDSGRFYSSLSNPYALKEGSGSSEVPPGWSSTGLQPSTGYYTYDPTFGAYGYGASYDLAARRKNATRESTATLKAWLSEHKKNPYPTKGEKIMLAIITKMTLTQVSTWFANARRRLKKENKMTWEPKNRTEDDDDDALASDDDKERDDGATERRRHGDYGANTANNTNSNNNNSNNNNSAAGADLAARTSVATTPVVAGITGAVGSHSAVTVPGPAAAPAPAPVPGAGAGVGGCVVSVVQPKEMPRLPALNKQPLSNLAYDNPPAQPLNKYSASQDPFGNAYPPLAKDEVPYGSSNRGRIWSLADTAAEQTSATQYPTMTPHQWPSNYAQPFGGGDQPTAVVATISMQPRSPRQLAYAPEVETSAHHRAAAGGSNGRDSQTNCANSAPSRRCADDIFYKRQHCA